jgi:hypothetical protein
MFEEGKTTYSVIDFSAMVFAGSAYAVGSSRTIPCASTGAPIVRTLLAGVAT